MIGDDTARLQVHIGTYDKVAHEVEVSKLGSAEDEG
jgi:hypothetical protein